MTSDNCPPLVAVIGLGYVGLPLAVEFAKTRPVVGFDTDAKRVGELSSGHDHTFEASPDQLARVTGNLRFSSDSRELAAAKIYIITVPTPIDAAKQPDLGPVKSASQAVGGVLSAGDLVIYESTVYPGATEEVCVPILRETSGLRFNEDFFVGYSPERINPGDHSHRLPDIVKVTSGSTPETAEQVDTLYREIITAGTHRAPSIRVAEATKAVENTQRDVNIALINEFALLFGRLGVDTHDVLVAAGTKWNFLPFMPGLVGGHCIGVDPYYVAHKAQKIGYHAEMVLAARRINDAMGSYIADQVVLLLAQRGAAIAGSRVLILGLAFKENCPDIRNTRVVDIRERLSEFGVDVVVADPWVDGSLAITEYGIELGAFPPREKDNYDAVILAVAHEQFLNSAQAMRDLVGPGGVVYDVKGVWPKELVDGRL